MSPLCHAQVPEPDQADTDSQDIMLEFRQGHKGGNSFHNREKLESNDHQLIQESIWSQGLRYAELEPLLTVWSVFALTVFVTHLSSGACLELLCI